MSEGAGPSGWQRAVDAYLAKFREQELHFSQLFLLWASALALVVLACAAFFLAMFWLFS